jgi:hypothetical protein
MALTARQGRAYSSLLWGLQVQQEPKENPRQGRLSLLQERGPGLQDPQGGHRGCVGSAIAGACRRTGRTGRHRSADCAPPPHGASPSSRRSRGCHAAAASSQPAGSQLLTPGSVPACRYLHRQEVPLHRQCVHSWPHPHRWGPRLAWRAMLPASPRRCRRHAAGACAHGQHSSGQWDSRGGAAVTQSPACWGSLGPAAGTQSSGAAQRSHARQRGRPPSGSAARRPHQAAELDLWQSTPALQDGGAS